MAEATARIALPDPELLSAAQQAVYDAIKSGPRGVVRGPALIWLHSPEYAARVQRVGEFLRWDTVLGQRLSELAILITARHYNAHFIWFNHHELAAENGVFGKDDRCDQEPTATRHGSQGRGGNLFFHD